jgi:hypothetical protein
MDFQTGSEHQKDDPQFAQFMQSFGGVRFLKVGLAEDI